MRSSAERYFIILFLAVLNSGVIAQSVSTNQPPGKKIRKEIRGQVIDAVTRIPVPFVSVTLNGSYYGIATNINGTFRFSSDRFLESDTIKFSSLGYEALKIPIEAFNEEELKLFTVLIKPHLYSLDEVIVRAKKSHKYSAQKIVKKAIENIGHNYPQNSFLLDGYYRDYLKNDEGYLNLFESRIQIDDRGFNQNDYQTSRARMISGGINPEFRIDSSKITNYADRKRKRIPSGEMNYQGSNELAILRLVDPVRNPDRNTIDYINIFRENFIPNHTFWHEGIVYLYDRAVYKIGFKSRPNKEGELYASSESFYNLIRSRDKVEGRAEGKIYIDSESYAILKINYNAYAKDRIHGDFRIWELNEEYRLIDGVPYLLYLSFNNAVEFPDYSDSSYFCLENVFIDPNKDRIGLEFNNPIDTNCLRWKNICRIKHENEALSFNEVHISDTMIYIYPKKFNNFLPAFLQEDASKLDIRMKKIKDIHGNIFEVYKFLTFYQYRELFVRNIALDYTPFPEGELFINNNNSIIYLNYTEITPEDRDYFNSEGLKTNK